MNMGPGPLSAWSRKRSKSALSALVKRFCAGDWDSDGMLSVNFLRLTDDGSAAVSRFLVMLDR